MSIDRLRIEVHELHSCSPTTWDRVFYLMLDLLHRSFPVSAAHIENKSENDDSAKKYLHKLLTVHSWCVASIIFDDNHPERGIVAQAIRVSKTMTFSKELVRIFRGQIASDVRYQNLGLMKRLQEALISVSPPLPLLPSFTFGTLNSPISYRLAARGTFLYPSPRFPPGKPPVGYPQLPLLLNLLAKEYGYEPVDKAGLVVREPVTSNTKGLAELSDSQDSYIRFYLSLCTQPNYALVMIRPALPNGTAVPCTSDSASCSKL